MDKIKVQRMLFTNTYRDELVKVNNSTEKDAYQAKSFLALYVGNKCPLIDFSPEVAVF